MYKIAAKQYSKNSNVYKLLARLLLLPDHAPSFAYMSSRHLQLFMVQKSEELHRSGTALYSDLPYAVDSLASTSLAWSDRTVSQLCPL